MIDQQTLLAALNAATDKLIADAAALKALVGGAPPPPPPLNDGSIAWPNKTPAQTLTDARGHVFSFGTNPKIDEGPQIWGYDVLVDGVNTGFTGRQFYLTGGDVYACNGRLNWFKCVGSPWLAVPQPFPALPVSSDGTVILKSDPPDFSQFLISNGGHVWNFGPLLGMDYWILRDTLRYSSGNAVKMTIKGGVVYAQSFDGHWWVDNGATWSQSGAPF